MTVRPQPQRQQGYRDRVPAQALCGALFTAPPPPEAGDSNYDPSVGLMLAVTAGSVPSASVSMAGHGFALVAEIDARFLVQPNLVSADEVIRVFVADRDPEPPVAFEHIVLKDTVPHAPAEVQAILAVAAREALLN